MDFSFLFCSLVGVGWLVGSPVRCCSSLGLELGLHRIYCLCAQYTCRPDLAMPSSLSLCHSLKNSSKLLSFTDTENNQFISYNFRWFAAWLLGLLAGWLYILWHFLWANKVCLTLPFPFSLFPEIVVHIQRQPWHILIQSTLCSSPKATISTGSFHRFFIYTISFLLHLILERANVHFAFFFALLILCCFRIAHLLWPQRVIRCLPWVHLQNAISTGRKKNASIVKGLISFV